MDLEYDSDDSSPPETLDQFREKWKKELSGKKHPNRSTTGHNNPVTNEVRTNDCQLLRLLLNNLPFLG